MATNTLIMSYVLKKMQNIKSPVNNRWFAHVNRQGTLTAITTTSCMGHGPFHNL